ncbi:hypothetical protein PTKIN_Ptkin13bG0021200 [Pterospermum kingtungense]
MERQDSVIGGILGLSDCGIVSQYDRSKSVNLTIVEQLIYSKPNNIFRDINVNNILLEEENKEHEEEEDFEEVNSETNSTNLNVPVNAQNTTFFNNID